MIVPEVELAVDSVIEKLNPREFIDDDGAKRQIFTFKGTKGSKVEVVFYAKEDLPFNKEILQMKQGFILGGSPIFRDEDEWKKFTEDVAASSVNPKLHPFNIHDLRRQLAVENGQALFFVENTPEHLLDLAFILGLNDPKWREARKRAVVDRQYTTEVREVVDNLIAGTVVNNQGQLRKRENQEGEALVLLSLLGDEQATQKLAARREVVAKVDGQGEAVRAAQIEELKTRLLTEGARVVMDYKAYHTTKYKPIITEEGIYIRSTFDASGGQLLRNTVHFSLAGPVSERLGGGGWESMDFVISADLSEIRRFNGNPKNMSEIDTYLTVSPGEYVFLPEAKITMPGKLPPGIFRQEDGKVTLYRKGPYSAADIDTIIETIYYNIHLHGWSIHERLEGIFKSVLAKKQSGGLSTEKVLRSAEWFQEYSDFFENLTWEKIALSLRTVGVKETVIQQLQNSPYGDVVNKEDIFEITQKIQEWLGVVVRDGDFTESLGHGEGSPESLSVALLAYSWGAKGTTSRQAHFNDSDGLGAEKGPYKILEEAKRVKQQIIAYDQKVESGLGVMDLGLRPRFVDYYKEAVDATDRENLMEYVRRYRGRFSDDPKIRRMHYLAGII
ncbi:MAG: hypothetical protein C4584_00925 [Armatimonadetes bacterium]|nr:MAG: hypothetical protein C4584_00925 [Armatimonadota bacterium]